MDDLASAMEAAKGSMNLRPCAREIGISPTTLTRLLRGHVPDQKTLRKVCEWLGVEPDQFSALGQLPSAQKPVVITKDLASEVMNANRAWLAQGIDSMGHR